jgi:hypothetical protein
MESFFFGEIVKNVGFGFIVPGVKLEFSALFWNPIV